MPIVGLCTGQFVLAELGLLDGKRCAVHFSLAAAMKQSFPDVIGVSDLPVVVDGGYITCPGGLASINLAMHLVTARCGQLRTQKALHYLMADGGFDQMKREQQDLDVSARCMVPRVINAISLMRKASERRSGSSRVFSESISRFLLGPTGER